VHGTSCVCKRDGCIRRTIYFGIMVTEAGWLHMPLTSQIRFTPPRRGLWSIEEESAAAPRFQTRFQTLKKTCLTTSHGVMILGDVTSLYTTTLKHGGWSEQPISVRPTSCMRAVFEGRQIVHFRGTLEAGNQGVHPQSGTTTLSQMGRFPDVKPKL